MVLDSLVYEDFVQRLLYLDSVDDIRRAIKEGRGLDAKRLYQTLESLEKTSLEEGKIAQHSLLLFVHNVIDELLWRSGRESSSVDEISTSDELIHRALNAPNSLRAYRILRNHRHLLNKQVLDNIEKQIVVNRLETVNTDSWLMLLCLVALLLDDRPVVARGYLFWASYYGRTGRYRNAVRRLTHGVKVSEDLNDTWLKLTANSVQGDLYERMGEIVKAIESYTKALSLAESSGDELSAANIHGVLAYCYRSMGYYSVALEHINVYLSASQQLGGLPEEANRRLLKGVLLEDLGQYDEGEVEYQRAADLAGAKGDQGNQFVAMTDVAASFLKSGNTREAVKRFREIAQIVERWGNPVIISSSRNNLGNALLAMGRPSDAFREFDKALGTKISARLGYGAAISYIGMGDASEALGKHKDAQLFYMLAWMLFLETGDISIMDMCVPRIASGKMDVGENEVSIIHSAREQAMQRGDMFHELLFTSILIDQCLRED